MKVVILGSPNFGPSSIPWQCFGTEDGLGNVWRGQTNGEVVWCALILLRSASSLGLKADRV